MFLRILYSITVSLHWTPQLVKLKRQQNLVYRWSCQKKTTLEVNSVPTMVTKKSSNFNKLNIWNIAGVGKVGCRLRPAIWQFLIFGQLPGIEIIRPDTTHQIWHNKYQQDGSQFFLCYIATFFQKQKNN